MKCLSISHRDPKRLLFVSLLDEIRLVLLKLKCGYRFNRSVHREPTNQKKQKDVAQIQHSVPVEISSTDTNRYFTGEPRKSTTAKATMATRARKVHHRFVIRETDVHLERGPFAGKALNQAQHLEQN